jgi:hypothetical protein
MNLSVSVEGFRLRVAGCQTRKDAEGTARKARYLAWIIPLQKSDRVVAAFIFIFLFKNRPYCRHLLWIFLPQTLTVRKGAKLSGLMISDADLSASEGPDSVRLMGAGYQAGCQLRVAGCGYQLPVCQTQKDAEGTARKARQLAWIFPLQKMRPGSRCFFLL